MRELKIVALALLLASLGAMAVCIFSDWYDGLCLPLALGLSVVGNGINVLSERKDRGEREKER